MGVQVEELNQVKKKLIIEVPEEQVKEELDSAYSDLRKTAKVKGFRTGKTPRSVLEQYFGKQVNSDVTARLIQLSYADAIAETNLKVIGSPKIDPAPLNTKGAYQYNAEVETHPDIDDLNYEGLKITKRIYPVTDEEIEKQVRMLQKKMARHQPIEEVRPIQDGDVALISFEGYKDGVPYIRSENYGMKLGDGNIDPAFDKEIIGMEKDEKKSFTIQFPEDHERLADDLISFDVTLMDIRKEILPEIDDEFVKMFGAFETVDDLKKRIEEDLKQGYEKRTEQEMNEQIFTALLAQAEFEAPEILIEHELSDIVSDLEKRLEQNGTNMKEQNLTEAKVRLNYYGTAVHQVKRYLLLAKLIEQMEMALTDEELEEGLSRMTESSKLDLAGVKAYYDKNPENFEYFKHALLEKKVLDHILTLSEIEETAGKIE